MKYLHVVIILLAMAGVSGCPDDAPPPPMKTAHLGARVALAAGEVWLEEKSTSTRLMSGAMLEEGATLKAEKGSRALVRLNNGAGIFMRGDTVMELAGDGVTLQRGELWADVPDMESQLAHFDLGDVKVSATGAGMDIYRDDKIVRVYVARGLAVVESAKGRVEVAAGEQAEVKGGVPGLSPVAFFDDWTGGMADRPLEAGMGGSAAGRIYGIDRNRPGSPPSELQIISQQIKSIIREGVAYTTVDQTFFNSASTQVEGWYWFTVPEGASIVRFAWEVNGRMVDGKVIERKQAKAAYEEAVQRAMDPALLEWIDARTCRARIFPVPAAGAKRIILAYTELLPLSDGAYRYIYPMVGDESVQIQEFSLQVDLGDDGEDFEISTLQDARVSEDHKTVSMRRSGYVPRSDFLLELKPMETIDNVRVMRYGTGANEADYVMLRYTPAVKWKEVQEVPGDVVVVLDTSAGGDTAEHQIRQQTAEAILRALGSKDRFAVMSTDLVPKVLFPQKGLAAATEANISEAAEKMAQLAPAGATDLGEMFSKALSLVHDSIQPAIVYVGDGQATSGETAADDLAERLRRAMGNSRARLFAIAVGAGADRSLLKRLADVGGGKMFRIDMAEQVVQESLRFAGMLKTPTITELVIDTGAGLDQVFTTQSGKLSEGEEAILLARTHHQFPDKIEVRGTLAGESFKETYSVDVESGNFYSFIPSLWARMYLSSLMGSGMDENRGRIISLGLQYGLMTPFTSFLVLEEPQPMDGPAYMQPWRTWSMNMTRQKYRPGVEEALSIPLFGFGCSSDSKEAPAEAMDMEMRKSADMSRSPMPQTTQAAAEQAPMEAEEVPAPPPAPAIDKSVQALDNLSDDMSGRGAGGLNPDGGERLRSRKMSASPKRSSASASGLAAQKEKGEMGQSEGRIGTGSYGIRGQRDDADESQLQVATTTQAQSRVFDLEVCSDAARRPLRERRLLWQLRLNRSQNAMDTLRIFKEAGKRCELMTARQRKVLLDLIAQRVSTSQNVVALLSAFSEYPAAKKYLARWIRRSFLDVDATMGLYFGASVNWPAVKTGLAALKTPDARLEEVRRMVKLHPEAEGRELLITVLMENGLVDDARREAERLHRKGEASPETLIVLCDILAQKGKDQSARRVCSELVEFNAQNPVVRQKLGDIFLRHQWYGDAYRQYATLVEATPDDAVAQLRLALAAAGMGKTDEALRIARKVATSEGELGAADPRPWAEALSVGLLAKMLHQAKSDNNKTMVAAVERQLKRTGMFQGQKQIQLIMWEDFEFAPGAALVAGDTPVTASNDIMAPLAGLRLFDFGDMAHPDWQIQLTPATPTDKLKRDVDVKRIQLNFDGARFNVSIASEKVTNV
ncbi:MAG: VWA domain-containing protein [Deltaproteobacteria bacterium]|nr:VWA domain-containing protein [Deltaproteobacteria bacterium]